MALSFTGRETFDLQNSKRFNTILIVYIVCNLLFGWGAASLSYQYNVAIGTSSTMTVVYSVLAFIFSVVYYPFYALLLNPLRRNHSFRVFPRRALK